MKRYTLLGISLALFIVFLPITMMVLSTASLCFWVGSVAKLPNLKNYGFFLAFSYDQFANTAVFMGSPEETISSRLGRAIWSGKAIWWVPHFAKLVNTMAYIGFGQKHHVEVSIERFDSKDKELVSWIK